MRLLAFAMYTLFLLAGGVSLGNSPFVRRWASRLLYGKQAGITPTTPAKPGLQGTARKHDHDHEAEAAQPSPSPAAPATGGGHSHDQSSDAIPGIAELNSVLAQETGGGLVGLSSPPPGEPGEEYPAPLPKGFYLPDDAEALGRTIGWPDMTVTRPTDEQLEGTAFVTMATGDDSARHALALVQSMRDVGTHIPFCHIMIFRGGSGSTDCRDDTSRRARGRGNIMCDGPDTNEAEITSQFYLDAFARLGCIVGIENPIADTPYIKDIPGGRGIAWGMALNKLRVFGLDQYRKVLWIDSDVLVLHNIDHLMLSPDFSAAFTNDCCNRNADAKMSGGMWVFYPSADRWNRVHAMLSKPIPGTADTAWLFGDMQVVLHLYGIIDAKVSDYKEWPFSRDLAQGTVHGLRVLPVYVNMSDDTMEVELLSGGRRGKFLPPAGLRDKYLASAEDAAASMEDGALDAAGLRWHMFDPRYDGLVGNCECLAERDLGPAYFTVHFTCLPVTPPVHKPGHYTNEAEFLDHVRTRTKGCMRFYLLKWYDSYARAVGSRLPPPYYEGPTVRIDDSEADAICDRNRQEAFDIAVEEERKRNAGLA